MSYRIPVAKPDIGQEEMENVIEAVRSGWISSKGPFIQKFESEFATYIGTKHGIATSNGTVALHLALTALGIGKGDEVLVPTLTFIAVANSVSYTGATPIFVDSHPCYWCMDPSDVERKITERTKAIITVHLYGHPCDMEPIMKLTREHQQYVIEDCAEAHGAEYKGRRVGSFGDISCFSFYGNKIITTGEGGMCLTNDEELAEKMRVLRDHGMDPKRRYWHDFVGFNYRMTNVQAAIGVAQVKKIEKLIARKRQVARMYAQLLPQGSNLTLAPEMPWAKNVYWFYSILMKSNQVRETIIKYLDKQGIETRPFFHPMHSLPPYHRALDLPISVRLSGRGLNLPSGPKITDEEVQHVAALLGQALANARV